MADMLSQDEIKALLGGAQKDNAEDGTQQGRNAGTNTSTDGTGYREPTGEEVDIIGEIGNINMGTAATTLSSLLNQKVVITTPDVKVLSWNEISEKYNRPCVGVQIDYTLGIQGKNILILENTDVKVITSLMMGKETASNDGKLTELDLSAIGEAMNQMIGSASTSLASLTKIKIDIATPKAFTMDFSNDRFFEDLQAGSNEKVIAIFFRMQVGDLIDSTMLQAIPMDFAFRLINSLKVNTTEEVRKIEAESNVTTNASNLEAKKEETVQYTESVAQPNVNAKSVQFQSFEKTQNTAQKENIGMLMDVPLEITVELGKTSKTIEEILEFSPGTVIELDKLAGEPIDILVNGKYIAKGEVVVIDENFAIRITNIVSRDLRF